MPIFFSSSFDILLKLLASSIISLLPTSSHVSEKSKLAIFFDTAVSFVRGSVILAIRNKIKQTLTGKRIINTYNKNIVDNETLSLIDSKGVLII